VDLDTTTGSPPRHRVVQMQGASESDFLKVGNRGMSRGTSESNESSTRACRAGIFILEGSQEDTIRAVGQREGPLGGK